MQEGIVVVGSVNHDSIFFVERLPRAHETLKSNRFVSAPGGKGTNQAVAAARAGTMPVAMLACIGDDAQGKQSLEYLQANNINCAHVQRLGDTHTGLATVVVETSGDNHIIIAPGANASVSASFVERGLKSLPKFRALLVQSEIPLDGIRAALEFARSHGAISILNPAPYVEGIETLLPLATIVTPNQAEAEAITGVTVNGVQTAAQAARQIQSMGAETVIVTLGGDGCFLITPEFEAHIPALPVTNVLDTTGAGDVFNGALCLAIAEQQPIAEACRFAAGAAAMSVGIVSASDCAPYRSDIDAFILRPTGCVA